MIRSSSVNVTRSASQLEDIEKQTASIVGMHELIARIQVAISAMTGVSGDIGSGDETS